MYVPRRSPLTKLFLACETCFSLDDLIGIFSTREHAEAAVRKRLRLDPTADVGEYIEEHVLDKMLISV
jgi:hypothetical protein